MKFVVVIATIRQNVSLARELIAQCSSTLTLPTDFHVLDGSAGIAQTYNRALSYLDDGDLFVTLDDDFLPPRGWQETVVSAFERIPMLGACAIDISDTEYGRRCMVAVPDDVPFGDIVFRELPEPNQNLGGICIAAPADIVRQVGPVPILTTTRHQLYQDWWRCMQIRKLGYRMGYVRGQEGYAVAYEIPETPDHHEFKYRDIDYCRDHWHEVLAWV